MVVGAIAVSAASYVPGFEPVFKLLQKVVSLALTDQANKAELRKLSDDLVVIQTSLEHVHNAAKQSVVPEQCNEALQRLQRQLEAVYGVLDEHSKTNAVLRGLVAEDFKKAIQNSSQGLYNAVAALGLLLHCKVDPEGLSIQRALNRIKEARLALMTDDTEAKLSIYVPLQYSLVPPTDSLKEQDKFSLETVAQPLLRGKVVVGKDASDVDEKKQLNAKSAPSVLLVQGAAGRGKSLFGWHVYQQYKQQDSKQAEDELIPLFISLPALRQVLLETEAKEDVLTRYFVDAFGVDAKTVPLLQQTRFLFLLDGLDELGSKVNVYERCKLHQWSRSVFVIFSRSGFLTDQDIQTYVVPVAAGTGHKRPELVRSLHLLQFSEQQREQYVQNFARSTQNVAGWSAASYLSALQRYRELQQLAQEPLTLSMVLNILPRMDTSSAGDQLRLDPRTLLMRKRSEIDWCFPRLRRAELYGLFFYDWADREIDRLLKSRGFKKGSPSYEDDFEECRLWLRDFCEKLAFEMFLHSSTEVRVLLTEEEALLRIQRRDPRLALSSSPITPEHTAWASELFRGDDGKNEAQQRVIRQCSPLRRVGSSGGGVVTYAFLHKSLQEYFAASFVCAELMLWAHGGSSPSRASFDSLSLCRRSLTADVAVLRFAAELVDGRVRDYYPAADDEKRVDVYQPLGRALFDVIYSSRSEVSGVGSADEVREPHASSLSSPVVSGGRSGASGPVMIAASNAVSILNAAGVPFVKRDFRGVRFGVSEVGAWTDLTQGMFYDCDFRGASLGVSRCHNIQLQGSDLRGVDLSCLTFGQSPMLLGHSRDVTSLVLSSDGSRLYSGSSDNTIREWSLSSGECVRRLEGHSYGVTSLVLSSDGSRLYSGSWDATIREWSLSSGECVRRLEGHSEGVTSLVLSSDGSRLYSGSSDTTIREWSLSSGECVRRLEGHSSGVTSLVLSSDGSRLYSGCSDTTIREWSLSSGEGVRRLEGHSKSVTSLVLSSDGSRLYSGSYDNTIREWSLSSGECVRRLEGHSDRVTSLVLSSDGSRLYSGSYDKTIREWSLSSGECVRRLEGHSDTVTSLVLSSDGSRLYSGSDDNTIREWSLSSGECVRRLEGHSSSVSSLVLSSDVSRLIVGDGGGAIILLETARRGEGMWC